MLATTGPKYAIGTKFFVPTTDRETKQINCPDCLGEKSFKVTAPSGDEFTMDCPRCIGSYRLSEVPSLRFDAHTPRVRADEITGYSVNEYGKEGVRYRGKSLSVEEDEIITDEATAYKRAEELAAQRNVATEKAPERIHLKRLGELPLREATIDQFKNGLYESWSAFRHLRETVDEIIANEDGYSFQNREAIVEALEDSLSTTHRYDFVFKGYTRAMEAVVALVNADDQTAPKILTALRERWAALPEDAQRAWQPPESIKTDWAGEPCPTY